METTAVQAGPANAAVSEQRGFGDLGGEDFFKLLIAQLTNQDPLEPMSNQELLQQMSSIREIELNATLTDSLKALAEQQQFGSAASLVGRYVTGQVGPDGQVAGGKVLAIRFEPDGGIILQLDSGAELDLVRLDTVTSVEQAARELIGRFVSGIDTRDLNRTTPVEGVVAEVRTEDGEVLLELDTGEQLRFSDVLSVGLPDGAAGLGTQTG